MRIIVAAMAALEKMVHSIYELTMHPAEKVHQPWIDHNLSQTREGLKWIDSLQPSHWLMDARMTQADITTTIVARFAAERYPDSFPEGTFPNLDALSGRVMELPAWQETIPSPEDAAIPVSLPNDN